MFFEGIIEDDSESNFQRENKEQRAPSPATHIDTNTLGSRLIYF